MEVSGESKSIQWVQRSDKWFHTYSLNNIIRYFHRIILFDIIQAYDQAEIYMVQQNQSGECACMIKGFSNFHQIILFNIFIKRYYSIFFRHKFRQRGMRRENYWMIIEYETSMNIFQWFWWMINTCQWMMQEYYWIIFRDVFWRKLLIWYTPPRSHEQ